MKRHKRKLIFALLIASNFMDKGHSAKLDARIEGSNSEDTEPSSAGISLPEAYFENGSIESIFKRDLQDSMREHLNQSVDLTSALEITVYNEETEEPTSVEYTWEVLEADDETIRVRIDFEPPGEHDQLEVTFEAD